MSMGGVDLDEQLEVVIDKTMLINLLIADPSFLAKVREAELVHTRRTGNRLGRWAQKEPPPKTIQPNTKQRIF